MKKFLYYLKILLIILGLGINIFLIKFIYTELNKTNIKELSDTLIMLVNRHERLIRDDWLDNNYNKIIDECSLNLFNESKEKLINKKISLTLKDSNSTLDCDWDNLLESYIKITGYNVHEFKIGKLRDEKLELSLEYNINKEKLEENITNLLDSFKLNMIGAKGKLVNGSMEIIDEGSEGRTYKDADKDALIDRIEQSIESDIFKDIDEQIEFSRIEINPKAESLKNINTKISSFSTSFAPGGSRGTNVSLAASRINGVVLAPGEILSVDKQILSRNKANGYLPAGSYANGRTVQTYGGGVCQVSSTLYGAVLRAGLIPVERNAHSMAVSYVPLGLDAAIAEGFKDLKIENTYDTSIYIEGYTKGGTLTFSIYGKEDLLNGYTYKPTSNASGLHATAKLQKIKDGEVVENIQLPSSSYRPHG